jgi:DnaJ-class molecular chaperone
MVSIVAFKTHYDTLQVPRDVDDLQLKKAYRTLAKRWHPDVCKEPQAESEFKKIQTAYSVLADRKTRRDYDMELKSLDAYGKPKDIFDDIIDGFNPAKAKPKAKRRTRAKQPRQKNASVELDEIPDGYEPDQDHLGGII